MPWVVTPSVFPETVTTVVQVDPSVLSWRLKSWVLKPASSPPAWAWRTTNPLTVYDEPRSTCRKRGAACEHHLSELPPLTLPFTALSGVSVVAHAALPLAALLSARFVPLAVCTVMLKVTLLVHPPGFV